MGKFDKYNDDKSRLLPSSGSTGSAITTHSTKAQQILDAAKKNASSASAHQKIYGDTVCVAIALDATGSMHSLLESAKVAIGEIISRLSKEAKVTIEIELFAYRDYDMPNLLLERSGINAKSEPLNQWLRTIRADGGGGNDGEAVEVALQTILESKKFAAVILAGDEPSNPASNIANAGRKGKTARELAKSFSEQKIPIHSFVVGNDQRTVKDFAAISQASGGKSGRLDGSKEMTDLAVMAILSAVSGGAAVRKYMSENPLSDNSQKFGQLLLGGS